MTSIVLIGMPGAGKTTLGKKLAQHFDLPFFDTDQLIEQHTGHSLQQNLDNLGFAALRQLEGEVISQYPWPKTPSVIATGGSAVYSEFAMQTLRSFGVCVYLKVGLETIAQRVQNWGSRGFAAPPGSSAASVFHERHDLYGRYADVTIECDALSEEQCLQALVDIYQRAERF